MNDMVIVYFDGGANRTLAQFKVGPFCPLSRLSLPTSKMV
ncbi:hypothetical protein Z949_624 [Sulfitobacter guttiformis KCTC 32187]|nr:hypothetical protein Z949_624 [Sulfitobacter guttiformis KCTC 32187]